MKCVDDVREQGRDDVESCSSVVSGAVLRTPTMHQPCHASPLTHRIPPPACSAQMGPLWECMAANQSYYAPQLDSLQEGDKSGSKPGGDTDAAGGSSRDPDDVTAEEVERYLEGLDKNEADANKK